MGIQVEYNPDLALRNISCYHSSERSLEECIPEDLKAGEVYGFFKKGQRNYWLEGEIPLVETKGGGQLSRPLASIIILEAAHYLDQEEKVVYTRGLYKVIDVFDPNDPPPSLKGWQGQRNNSSRSLDIRA